MKASREGRTLVLEVDPTVPRFVVQPVSARRGRALVDAFLATREGALSVGASESMFIEALGAGSYSRASGYYVERWGMDRTDPTAEPFLVTTWRGEAVEQYRDPEHTDPIYVARTAGDGEPEIDGEAVSQSDLEFLCLCAFLWHTVVGFEAVEAFVAGGGGTEALSKVVALLLIRGVLSPSPNSLSGVTALSDQMANSSSTSPGTASTASSSGAVALPARPQDRRPKQGKRRDARSRTASSGKR